ncbi:MAG: hypothetical protein GY846_20875 [Deltaproteobacteria bacterium]|nr:hypothetical protein [Deltaproteobacteria bacterium]
MNIESVEKFNIEHPTPSIERRIRKRVAEQACHLEERLVEVKMKRYASFKTI